MSRLTIENFKDSKTLEEFNLLHPRLRELCEEMHKYCLENQQPFIISEAITSAYEDANLVGPDGKTFSRVSKSHQESRAVDVVTRLWPQWFLDKFINHFMDKYNDEIGAFSKKDGKRRLIKYHVGTAPHAHVQLDTTFAIKAELT